MYSLIFLAFIYLCFSLYILRKKYSGMFNPIFFPLILGLITQSGISILNAYSSESNLDTLHRVILINLGYYISYATGAALRFRSLEGFLIFISKYTPNKSNFLIINKINKIFLAILILSYISLVLTKSTDWISNPRLAYMDRSGAGVFWAMFATSIPIAMICSIWIKKDLSDLMLIKYALLFSLIGYFTGSKQTILGILLVSLYYRHVFIKNISDPFLFIWVSALGFAFIALTLIQGSYNEILSFVNYFDMLANTVEAIEVIGDNYQYGTVFISSFWAYIPRSIFPDKPFEYGSLLINAILFPGAAEDGYTPALLAWFQYFYDFSVFGVILFGLSTGAYNSVLFNAFLQKKKSLFLFVVNCGSGFMIFNTPSYMIGFLLCLLVMSKFVLFQSKTKQ